MADSHQQEEEESFTQILSSLSAILTPSGQTLSPQSFVGDVFGIIIGPHWLPTPLHHFLSAIALSSQQLSLAHKPISFLFVASDRDPDIIDTLHRFGQSSEIDPRPDLDCFLDVVHKLPPDWLAVPFKDSLARSKLAGLYKTDVFGVAFVGADGRTHTKHGLRLLEKWGVDAYPFDDERIEALKREAEERVANQDLKALLVHEKRDYLISSKDEQKVKVEELVGKPVALYFSAHWCPPCQRFTPLLAGIYNQLKERKIDFEVVFVSSDEDEASFNNYFSEMPWLAVPYSDLKTKKMLNQWFEVEGIPTLVILDEQGKTLQAEGMEMIYKYGIEAYPFTADRLAELQQEEEAKRASQTLETILVTEGRDFVISKFDPQVKVSSLTGKTVGLYFSAHWCPPCRKFTPKLKSIYDELKSRGEEFEIIFISSDRDEESFKEYYESMPWLALPFHDKSKGSLSQYFDVNGIPQLVIIGPDGKTVTTDGRSLIREHGADAFPFTEDRIAEVQKFIDAKAEKLPKQITIPKHEHALDLTDHAYEGQSYVCDYCDEQGTGWVYHCSQCVYDLHLDCVGASETAGEEQAVPSSENGSALVEAKSGFVCEGDVCQRA